MQRDVLKQQLENVVPGDRLEIIINEVSGVRKGGQAFFDSDNEDIITLSGPVAIGLLINMLFNKWGFGPHHTFVVTAGNDFTARRFADLLCDYITSVKVLA